MASNTSIAWTDRTFNPIWGCEKISAGCKFCYAEAFANRLGNDFWGNSPRRTFGTDHWDEPRKWNRDAVVAETRERVFCGSMCDVFEDHPTWAVERPRLWSLIKGTPHLDWQLLSKRAENIAKYRPDDWGDGYPNVWLGVSIESNAYVSRADVLRQIPAVVRFVSYEPALDSLSQLDLTGIDWVIYGGESGSNRRPDDPAWAMEMATRCEAAKVAFFFKQVSDRYPGRGTMANGKVLRQFPVPRK